MSYVKYPDRLLKRFWAKVDKGPHPKGCWIWKASVDLHGYGRVGRDGHETKAHRYAYAQVVGPVPRDRDLCHHCDTPACVNPAHMFIGTRLDNMRDAAAKDRIAHGERAGGAKLTTDAVREMRSRYAAGGVSLRALGEAYGVCTQQAHRIIRGERWARVEAAA